MNLSSLPALAAFACLLAFCLCASARPSFLKPPPEGVTEVVGTGITAVVELRDRTLLANTGARSADGGKTWVPGSLGEGVGGDGLLRLQSGALALTTNDSLRLSQDEGKTWSMPLKARLLGTPLHAALTQLSTGRLLWPARACYGNMWHPDMKYEDASAYGTWRGIRVQLEGHGHIPEVSIAGVSRSDDQGQSWQCGLPGVDWGESTGFMYSAATLMGWFGSTGQPTDGDAWVTDCDEPTVAECPDGSILFFARSTVGRIVASTSTDGGQTWTLVRPTNLAASYSPPRLVRIPGTGNLLCIWNQVSAQEIRRGYRRGRLSCAVSPDGGKTWQHFQTLELSEGLQDVDRVEPEYPIPMVVRSRKDVGEVPDGWATFDYPSISFAADRVFVMYYRAWIEEQAGGAAATLGERNPMANTAVKTSEHVLRVYPMRWFTGG